MFKIKNNLKKRIKRIIHNILKINKKFNQRIFFKIYKNDAFNFKSYNKNSKSGPGSNEQQTLELIIKLPILLKKYNIESLLDIPCGDFYWMSNVDLSSIEYLGADIVEEIIKNNKINFLSENTKFKTLDIINDKLPKVDLIICRDLFVHLKYDQILKALDNIKKSDSKYLLTTSFIELKENIDIDVIGVWRPINLSLSPFNLLEEVDLIYENCTESEGKFNDKHLILYLIKNM